MLKVYNRKTYVSINGEPWEPVGRTIAIMSANNPIEKIIFENKTFEECFEYLGHHCMDGMSAGYTFFRHKPAVYIRYSYNLSSTYYKHFNTISYKHIYNENDDITLNDLMEDFAAKDVIEYLKERGITTCPIVNK